MTNDPRPPSVGDGELPVQPGKWVPMEPTQAECEFGLNNQMEDPSDDESSGFAAGVNWLLAWQADQLRRASQGQPAPDLAGVLEALEDARAAYEAWGVGTRKLDGCITSLRARMGKPT